MKEPKSSGTEPKRGRGRPRKAVVSEDAATIKKEYFGAGRIPALSKATDLEDKEFLQVQTSNKVFQFYQDYVKPAESRDQLYVQVEDMGYDSIVNSVLELYADDSFGNVLEGKDRSIWCTCHDQKVRDVVDEFIEESGVLERVWSIAFNHTKWGDHFLKVDGETGHGITNIDYDIHPKLIKRYEKNGSLFAFSSSAFSDDSKETIYFSPWQFVHFRNGIQKLRDKLFFGKIKEGTYGDPLLSQSILSWRKLNMMEDSMVLYRNAKISRPMLVKINMEGIAKSQQREYFDRVVNRFEYTSSFSPNQGIYQQQAKALSACEPIYIPVTKDTGDITHDDWSDDPSVSSIIDVEYMRNKLYGSFRVPPQYLGIMENSGLSNDSLVLMSMRYARSVRRIKMQVMWGLKRLCRIHLAYRDPSLLRHEFDLNSASATTAEDLTRAETTTKIIGFLTEFVRMLEQIGVGYDRIKMAKWCIKHLNLNDFDIKDILKKVEAGMGGAQGGAPMPGMPPDIGGMQPPQGGVPEMGAAPAGMPPAGPGPEAGAGPELGALNVPGSQFLSSYAKDLEAELRLEGSRKMSLFDTSSYTNARDISADTPDKYKRGTYDFKEVREFIRATSGKRKGK